MSDPALTIDELTADEVELLLKHRAKKRLSAKIKADYLQMLYIAGDLAAWEYDKGIGPNNAAYRQFTDEFKPESFNHIARDDAFDFIRAIKLIAHAAAIPINDRTPEQCDTLQHIGKGGKLQ